jgi:hypothetical protein
MAPVGLLDRPWNSTPTEAAGPLLRLAIALTLLCTAASRLPADELPGLLLPESSSAETARLAAGPTSPFGGEVHRMPFWSGKPDLALRFVTIDDRQLPSNSFGQSSTGAGSGFSSFWNALGRWESRVWGPERPTIILTGAETSSISFEGEAPPLPHNDNGFAPAPNWPDGAPAQADSDFQSIDVCGCPPIRFTDDAWAFVPRLGHDAWGLVNWDNAIVLGVALGGSLALRGEVDQDVRNWTAQHPDRWGEGSKIVGDIGVAQYQIPVILGAYAFTVWHQDDYEHQMMTSLISSYTIFGLSTLAIKGIADTKRPSDTWNGGSYGFPSWHDGSMFCMAAVIDEYEGHWVGVPLYVLAGLIGWSRIDTRDHDLSDVVFGGVLGYVIGKSVAGRALYGDSRAVHIVPYWHPSDGSAGLMFDTSF